MRFDCGEEWEEKVARLKRWHRFYAIWPRKVAPHDCRWFEWIERKGECYQCDGVWWVWQYRALA